MDFSGDPDLTPEGHGQALRLLDRVLKKDIPTPTALWVSPKKRAQSTFRPLAQHFDLPLQIKEPLLEQTADETLQGFRERIEVFLNAILNLQTFQPNDVLYICTHYDWMVESMPLIPCSQDLTMSEFSHWSPCQYVAFSVQQPGLCDFIELKRIQL